MQHGTVADALKDVIMSESRENETYKECKLAEQLGLNLRLVGTTPNIPIYSTPRIIRFAAFAGMNLLELDAPASHGRQILKYAQRFGLQSATLASAFTDVESVRQFRSSFPGIAPTSIKQIVNLLSYGSSGKDWLKQQELACLPQGLQLLKDEIKAVVNHMAANIDPHWYSVIRSRRRWRLTLLSIHCQLGERADLDLAVQSLPVNTVLHGWLGDSILIAPGPQFDVNAFLRDLAAKNVILTVKPLPADDEEYFRMYREVVGHDFDRSCLSGRALRQHQAKEYAQKYLNNPKAMKYLPHLEFAIAVENLLPMVYNPDTKQTEFYSAAHGRWFEGGGHDQVKGEVLSDALIETFAPTQWGYVDLDGRLKVRRVKAEWDDSCFRSNSFLNPVGEAIKNLRFRRDTSLDIDPSASKVINFEGQHHLDFSTPVPEFDWDSDDQLEAAIYLPLKDLSVLTIYIANLFKHVKTT